jgi:two-component system phosphate regulon sensor histidine kinase PhoR
LTEAGRERREASLIARRRAQVGLATLAALLVAVAGVAVFAITRLYTTAEERYVKEAFPLRTYARDVISQMLNEETAVRGYVITAYPPTLGPYHEGRAALERDLDGLDGLTTRRPEIRDDVTALRTLVRRLDAFYARQIALVRKGDVGQLQAQHSVLLGKALFDEFRNEATVLLGRSEEIVAAAEDDQHRTFVSTLTLVAALAAAAVGIGIVLLVVLPERLRVLYRREEDARRLAERGARAARALEHVVDAVVLLDPAGAIRYWNPAAVRVLEVAEDEALGRPAAGVVPDWATDEQGLARGGAAVVPLARDAGERWVAVAQTRFPEGRVVVLRDVTAEHQLERARSEFLATASHELRTPLAAVYGAVLTLRRPDRAHEPELDERLLTMIEEESQRLAGIVDQILVSAELDRRQVILTRESCDLRELCRSVVASAEVRAGERHTVVLDAPEPVFTECDPARLRQVVVNLLDNALKYSPDGGRIDVRVRALDHAATIEVEDEGVGIAPEIQGHVFEKFFRADAQMLNGVGGSGLGLYISRELVEQMGGTISARSRPGAGSTFTVELARSPAP